MTRLLAACAALLAALPGGAAPVPKGAGATVYFPTAPGAKWVYECADGQLETAVVSEVEKLGDELVVTRAGADGTRTRYTRTVVSAAGIWQDRELASGETATVWVLKAGLKSGESWDVADGGKRTVYGPEPVEVPAGKFTALRVVWEHDGRRVTSWYAPAVGEVKRVTKQGDAKEVVTRALKSFQTKADKN